MFNSLVFVDFSMCVYYLCVHVFHVFGAVSLFKVMYSLWCTVGFIIMCGVGFSVGKC